MPRKIVQEITAVDKTKSAFRSVTGSLNRMKGLLAGLGVAVSAASFVGLTRNALQSADEIQKLSQRLGASTEALSQYRLVAERTGVSFRTLSIGLQRLQRRVSEAASGTGEARNALRELGLEASALESLAIDQQFEVIADAFVTLETAADRTRVAAKLFDSEGVALIQTMQGGSAAIRDIRAEADALGLTLSQEAADGAVQANDALTNLGALAQGLGLTLASVLGPTIQRIAEWLQVNLPRAVQAALDAFDTLRRFVVDTGGVITSALASISGGLADAADFVGADQLSRALQRTADGYSTAARSAAAYSVELQAASESNENLRIGLEAGITFNQLRNRALAETVRKEQALAVAKQNSARATREQIDPVEQYIASLQKEIDVLGLTNAELREYELRKLGASEADIARAISLEEEREVYEAINAIEEENQRLLEAKPEKYKAINAEMEKTKKLGEELGPIISDSFGDAIVEGKKFSEILKGLEQDLIRVLTRRLVTRPLTNAIGGLLDGFSFGGLFGRANGGPVSAGRPYMVGERGPELFVPAQSGRVENSAAMGPVTVVVQGVTDSASFMRNREQVARAAASALRQAQAVV